MKHIYRVWWWEREWVRNYLMEVDYRITWKEKRGWFLSKFTIEGNKEDVEEIVWDLDSIREVD